MDDDLRTRRFRQLRRLILVSLLCGILLFVVVVPGLIGSRGISMTGATSATVKIMTNAVKMYAVDHDGAYPIGGSEVWKLLMKETHHGGIACGPYLEEVPKDAWGVELSYQYPGFTKTNKDNDRPDIWSLGADHDDVSDNIGNW